MRNKLSRFVNNNYNENKLIVNFIFNENVKALNENEEIIEINVQRK